MYFRVAVVASILLVSGCANPLNRVTSDDYAQTCTVAESNGRLEVAEEACYRALVNVDMGNLGPELKSQRLYNLGRIKRQLAKYEEAEKLFTESLTIEEKLSAPTDPKIGRRLVELSVSLAGQDKWEAGAVYLKRALPIAPQFAGRELSYTALTLQEYGKRLRAMNQTALAEQFEKAAASLQ
ncbi:tetratricopeptide repeat protein [Thioalbus denitrificans]|uniref:tetratricopeptide repeat protein n=1 Tax=Thioalbus denitrificans TaxID=547122 RepID=UPI000DF2FFEB|nr:tetratricopeptide repeat protein [Thioalbus denitrificans]